MGFNQEPQLALKRRTLGECVGVIAQTPSPSGHGDAVVSRKAQRLVQEFVHLLPVPAVATVDGGGADALSLEFALGNVNRLSIEHHDPSRFR